jgi:chromosome segregation ATPase
MVAPPSEPLATTDLGSGEAGGTRRLLLDEMLAERARPPLPPAPKLTVEPVPVDAAPIAGRRGARKRLAEVEALARRNLRAAEEARRYVDEERQLLEEEASARTAAERTASGLRRELERLRSTEEQRAAQARFAATHAARTELAGEIDRVHEEHARVVDELDRLRGTLFDHDSLLDEYSRRLRDEQEAQAKARGDQVRAEEAQRVAERNLEIATETARRRAEEDLTRFTKVETAWREACIERDRVTGELRAITTGDGELARQRVELEAARDDTARLLAELDVQAARADGAEAELATAREGLAQAERIAADASEGRDLAGIALETTRSELAERTEALDAERSASQARIADLVAQLATATRTAESATERSADLESRLDAAITARDNAVGLAETLTDQLARARTDTEQLRTQAASIGDELAANQAALETSRKNEQSARTDADRARREAKAARELAVPSPAAAGPVDAPAESPAISPDGAPSEMPEPVPTSFDAAIASAFRQELVDYPSEVVPAAASDEQTDKIGDTDKRAKSEKNGKAEKKPTTKFRTAEPDAATRPVRAGGPVVELEASLVRELEPIEPAADVVEPAPAAEPKKAEQPWRRTAMAALTDLATDSDDLTPRRRR